MSGMMRSLARRVSNTFGGWMGGKAAWIFGPGSGTDTQPPASGLRIQSSILGKPQPIGCGQTRIAANLDWYGDFVATPQSTGGGKGLGGGGKGQTSGFLYSAAVIMALGKGPIAGIGKLWDQSGNIHRLSDFNLSVAIGSYSQTAFGYLVSHHPDQALAYRGLAQVGSFPMNLGSNASLPNLGFEVTWGVNGAIPGLPDADPAAWITYYLTDPFDGAGFPSAFLGDLSAYSDWCIATGMVVSDGLTERKGANAYLGGLAIATDSEFVWADRKLILVPYGDVTITANGATFTPAITPIYDLGEDDFLPNTGSTVGSGYSGSDPVVMVRSAQSSVLNDILVEYLDRTNNYNPTIVEAKNDAAIQFDTLRPSDTKSWHFFALQNAAIVSAHLQLGRQQVRNQYSFTTDQRYIRLNPMDVVSITRASLGLDRWPVRVKEITENQQDQSLTFLVEDLVPGSGTPFGYNAETQCCVTGGPVFNKDPGTTVFVAWDATLCAVADGPALLVAAAGQGSAKNPRIGEKGLEAIWYYPKHFADNPTASGDQTIFKSAPNDSGAVFTLKAIFHGASAHVQLGLEITATPAGGSPVTISEYADGGAQAAIPAGGYGLIVSWDLTGATWALHARANAGTLASFSANEGAAIDPNHPLFQSPARVAGIFGTYSEGDGSATSAMYRAQNWVGLDDDVDLLDLAIPDSVWDLFFCNTGAGANAPKDLALDGSIPTGCPPTVYFRKAPGTGGTGAGDSTGCLAGTVTTVLTGSVAAVGAGTIPACGSYQAVGMAMDPTSELEGLQPFGGVEQTWGSCIVYISTDGGTTYNPVDPPIPGPSPIGKLTAIFPLHVDPDMVDTLSLDLSESLGALNSFANSDADAGRTRSVILTAGVGEIIDYSTAALTGANRYDLTTYIRRGQLGTAPAAHAIGDDFAVLGANSIAIHYPVTMIGQTIMVKFQGVNSAGGALQDLATLPATSITLAGPGLPAAPASITATQIGATGAGNAVVFVSWAAAAGCGIAGYNLAYNIGAGDVALLTNANQQSMAVTGLAAGSTTFKVWSVDSIGQVSAAPATVTITVV